MVHVEETFAEVSQGYGYYYKLYMHIDPQWNQANFLLQATRRLSLTHAGTTDLCEATSTLVETVTETVYKRVMNALENHDISVSRSLRDDIFDSCFVKNPFDGLSTRATREAYYRKHFHYVVSLSVLSVCNYYTFQIYDLQFLYLKGAASCNIE